MIETFFVGTLIGAVVAAVLINRMVSSALDQIELAETVKEIKENQKISARIEEFNGIFYVYKNDTNDFLAQGSDEKELLEHLTVRKIHACIHVTHGDPEVIAKFKSTASPIHA